MPPNPHPLPEYPAQLSLLPLFSRPGSTPGTDSRRCIIRPRRWPAWLESVATIVAVVAFGFGWIGLETAWRTLTERAEGLGSDAAIELSSELLPQKTRLTRHSTSTREFNSAQWNRLPGLTQAPPG